MTNGYHFEDIIFKTLRKPNDRGDFMGGEDQRMNRLSLKLYYII